MSRYAAMFDRCGKRSEVAFGGFAMLGDPDADRCAAYLDALVDGGADMVELGIPFSDPVADGPIIQAAAQRAMKAGIRTSDALDLIARFRERHHAIPIGVLTYANIVGAKGVETFCRDLAAAGADSLLLADVPTIEAEPYSNAARAAGIDLVMIAATNTPRPAIERIAILSSGYTYCVARAGVTGPDGQLSLDHGTLFAALRDVGAAPPVLGFGITTPAQVGQAVSTGAAGVICGSAIVERIANGSTRGAIATFVTTMKDACRRQP